MKLNVTAWANASAVFMGILYLACAFLVTTLPGISKLVAGSWFHGLNIDLIWTGAARPNFLPGLISAVVLSWISGWVFAWLYNKLSK